MDGPRNAHEIYAERELLNQIMYSEWDGKFAGLSVLLPAVIWLLILMISKIALGLVLRETNKYLLVTLN